MPHKHATHWHEMVDPTTIHGPVCKSCRSPLEEAIHFFHFTFVTDAWRVLGEVFYCQYCWKQWKGTRIPRALRGVWARCARDRRLLSAAIDDRLGIQVRSNALFMARG